MSFSVCLYDFLGWQWLWHYGSGGEVAWWSVHVVGRPRFWWIRFAGLQGLVTKNYSVFLTSGYEWYLTLYRTATGWKFFDGFVVSLFGSRIILSLTSHFGRNLFWKMKLDCNIKCGWMLVGFLMQNAFILSFHGVSLYYSSCYLKPLWLHKYFCSNFQF